MNKLLISIFFIFSSAIIFAQTDDLEIFVQEQNAKLEYNSNKLVTAPNTNVKLIPPEHFEPDESINGFVHKGSAATIQVIEVEGISFRNISASMTEEYIESQNYRFKEKINLQTATSQDAVIFFVEFVSGDMIYERAMFFTGEENTIWVNSNYPLNMKKLLFPAIEACLISIE
ncbi:MAG: hypothetical protein GX793_02885 [Bacteroidales bacterium]|jgi:hypothetical protein|nr:hypothetical protein [Bacteroidales bacterium]MCK9498332.1 hypothetical protein [Bacteroidales bacterium]MDY0314510.1 hypothetical protein [Bacteroidales bacterium]NLB85988.1 hypothetical protein [Bacteroidales bacterium]